VVYYGINKFIFHSTSKLNNVPAKAASKIFQSLNEFQTSFDQSDANGNSVKHYHTRMKRKM